MAGRMQSGVQREVMPGWFGRFRRVVFGRPVPSAAALEHRLPVGLALPVFASDALSSVAYATEEILIVLAATFAANRVGSAAGLQVPITLAIVGLILIVAASYRMAIAHYPTSGGSYTVAKHNLGAYPGLTAAAALAIDYIMTVAVSVSAGVAALTSAFPVLYPWRVWLAVVLVAFIAFVNLRGVREAGWIFALPAYSFIMLIGILIFSSLYHYLTGTVVPAPPPAGAIAPLHSLALLVILRAFSNGCSAMTGIEAVSNGVSAFKVPEVKHAQQTMVALALILMFLFTGVGFSAHAYQIVPTHLETVVSQLARSNFGGGVLYHLIAYATLAILLVAANTSYAGFPRLLAIVAADGYAPRILNQLGDKMVYNRGIYALTAISMVLILLFNASVNALIPLYAVGVFVSFTLAQAGLARKVSLERKRGWRQLALMSGTGALITGLVALVIAESKFMQGAWVVILLIPLLVFAARAIKAHYDWFSRAMAVDPHYYKELRDPAEPITVITLLSDLNRGALEGLDCAMDIAGGRKDSHVRALHVELAPHASARLQERWRRYVEPYVGKHVRLDVVPSPYRWLVPPVLDYIDRMAAEHAHDRIVVIIPEFETGNPITHLLHNASARRLYAALLDKPHVTIVSCRFFMRPKGVVRLKPLPPQEDEHRSPKEKHKPPQ
jgi:amino acid transporter